MSSVDLQIAGAALASLVSWRLVRAVRESFREHRALVAKQRSLFGKPTLSTASGTRALPERWR